MIFSNELIDEVVRNVMRELKLSPTPATTSSTVIHAASSVELSQRVITEDVLAGQIAPGATVVVPTGAVLTPSGRDYIRRHRIVISSVSSVTANGSSSGLVLVVGDMKSISSAAKSAGWAIDSAAGNFDAANLVAQKTADQRTVCCSDQPSVIACMVNRNTQRRAAVVNSETCLPGLLNDMNPDTVCLSVKGWSFMELLRMLKKLSGNGGALPAGWKELA
jgi:hypothetical protein